MHGRDAAYPFAVHTRMTLKMAGKAFQRHIQFAGGGRPEGRRRPAQAASGRDTV